MIKKVEKKVEKKAEKKDAKNFEAKKNIPVKKKIK